MVCALFLYLIDNTLIFWFEWPGIKSFFIHLEIFSTGSENLTQEDITKGWIELVMLFGIPVMLCALVVFSLSLIHI